jgi:hypothetical protein
MSAEGLARAVWAADAGNNDITGSMGEKMNDAGSASNPWKEELVTGFTADRIIRLMAAVLLGESTGHPAHPVLRGLLGTEDVVTADVDSNGNRSNVELGP